MNRKLQLADNLLLVGVIAVVAVVAFSLLAAILSTIVFAVKVMIVVIAIGVGWRVVTALTGGRDDKRELGR